MSFAIKENATVMNRFFKFILNSFRFLSLIFLMISCFLFINKFDFLDFSMVRVDPIPHTKELMGKGDYYLAGVYLDFYMNLDYMSKNEEARKLVKEIEEVKSSALYKLWKVKDGIVDGQSNEPIGNSVGLMTDLFVIGDIRDFGHEGINYIKGKETDSVLWALSTLGIAISAVQVGSAALTPATAGTSASVAVASTIAKRALSFLKKARKIKNIPKWMSAHIIDIAKAVKKGKSVEGIGTFISSVYVLSKSESGIELLKKSTNLSDLIANASFVKKIKGSAYPVLHDSGYKAIEVVNKFKALTIKQLTNAVTYGKYGIEAVNKKGYKWFEAASIKKTGFLFKGKLHSMFQAILKIISYLTIFLNLMVSIILFIPYRKIFDGMCFIKRKISSLFFRPKPEVEVL
jgi:hypothetical protein